MGQHQCQRTEVEGRSYLFVLQTQLRNYTTTWATTSESFSHVSALFEFIHRANPKRSPPCSSDVNTHLIALLYRIVRECGTDAQYWLVHRDVAVTPKSWHWILLWAVLFRWHPPGSTFYFLCPLSKYAVHTLKADTRQYRVSWARIGFKGLFSRHHSRSDISLRTNLRPLSSTLLTNYCLLLWPLLTTLSHMWYERLMVDVSFPKYIKVCL